MKRIAIAIVAIVSCFVMNAQDVKVKSRVELKGGKADIVGYAELQDDGGYLIETESGDLFYYSSAEIKRIIQLDMRVKTKDALQDISGDRSKTKGYMGVVEASWIYPVGVSIINGYRFSQHFYLGVGTGVAFDSWYDDDIFIPAYLHFRTEFTKRKVSPYVAVNLGVAYDTCCIDIGYIGELCFGVRSYNKRHGSMWYGLAGGWYGYDLAVSLKVGYSF